MLATFATVDCYSTLGFAPGECDECEGRAVVTFHRGPHEEIRECEQCRGTGVRHPCPHCPDGADPVTGDMCETCNGYGSLH
ncbi:hypothetical protein [Streptomyces rimosus]|uniref:hypothetical protein n=1 Tax=Streptomyces rimosus TaxID=1927 RepID=UPI0037D1AF2F